MRATKQKTSARTSSTLLSATVPTTRRKLIDAAHALIWANSYGHVSVDDICHAAGVQKGSFYHFFPTKAELAAAALEDHWLLMRPKLDAIFDAHPTAAGQLRALCRAILARQQEALATTGRVCGCPYATLGGEISGNSEALRTLSQELSKRFCEYFERLLRNAAREKQIPARGVGARALEMHLFVIGTLLHARITNSLKNVGQPLETSLFHMSGLKEPTC